MRTYKRDARGRFSSGGGGGRSAAPQRLSFSLAYHGTGAKAAEAIRKGGYRPSDGGVFGAGVYASSSRRIARGYGDQQPDFLPVGRRGRMAPFSGVVTHRIPKPRLQETAGKRQTRSAVKAGKAAKVKGDEQGIVLMGKEVADKTMVRSTGKVRKPRQRGRGK